MSEKEKTVEQLKDDILKLQQRVEELEKSESELKQVVSEKHRCTYLIENSSDFIAVASLDGQMISLNKAGQKLVGIDNADEVKATNISDYIIKDDLVNFQEIIIKSIMEHGHWEGEFRIRNFKTDKPIPVDGIGFLIEDLESGRPIAIATVIRDTSSRKLMEAKLIESEGRWRSLVENINDVIFIVDTDGIITYISSVVKRVMGYDPVEIIGQHFSNYIYPDDLPGVVGELRSTLAGELRPYDYRVINKNNQIRYIRTSSRTFFKEGQLVGLIGLMIDITDQKLSEMALQESEKKLRKILDSSPGAITVIDLNGKIIDCNQASVNMVGFHTKDEIVGKNGFDLIVPKDREKAIERLKIVLVQGFTAGVEYSLLAKDGREIPVELSANVVNDPSGNPVSVIIVTTDITNRKKLEESELFVKTIISSVGEGVIVYDLELRYRVWNKFMEELTGLLAEQVIGKSALELFPHLTQQGIDRLLMQALEGETVRSEDMPYYVPQTGKKGWVLSVYSPHRNVNGEIIGMVATVRDITERKQAEANLNNQYAILKSIIDSPNAPILSVDSNYCYTSFNTSHALLMKSIYGVDIQIGKSILGYMSVAEDYERAKENFDRVLKGEQFTVETYSGEELLFRPYLEISHNPVKNAEGKIIGVSVFARDITERKQAEEAILKSEQLYRSAIEAAGAVPYLRDYTTNRYEFIGEGIKTLTGYSAEELTPELWESITYESILSGQFTGLTYNEAINKANVEKSVGFRLDTVVIARDGEELWLSDSSVQMRNKQGKLTKSLGILQDITERERAEENLRESNHRLEETLAELKATQQQIIQQERLRALGQLASGIAHDFNNVLTPILGYSDMLLTVPTFLNDKERIKNYLKVINTAAEDAKGIVSRLREFYRNREENEAFMSVNLNQVVQQAIQLTQPKWKDQAQANGVNIVISTDLQEIPLISGREIELRESLTNLIINSVDAITTNGTINLQTRSSGTDVILKVTDNGIGMTEKVKQRCFEPFFSTKGLSGTGLGLSMVYGIIRRHKGTIEVESELGKGTTFMLHLPIATDIKDKQKTQEVESLQQSLHVLVVDDEPLIQDMLGEYLANDGHSFIIASNGRDGLVKFRSGIFDLVITDRAMPDMSGDQLASIVKQSNPGAPIIMITGFGEIMESSGEIPECVDYLLSKPVTLNTFRKALLKAISDKI